jgi:hypothetical protein
VERYLSAQGRFRHLGAEEVAQIQAETDRAWEELREQAAKSARAQGEQKPFRG